MPILGSPSRLSSWVPLLNAHSAQPTQFECPHTHTHTLKRNPPKRWGSGLRCYRLQWNQEHGSYSSEVSSIVKKKKKNPTKTKWPIQALLFLRPPAALRDLHSALAHSPPPHLPQPCHQPGSQPPPTRSYHANTANTSTLANSSCGYFPSSTALLNLKKHDQTEPGPLLPVTPTPSQATSAAERQLTEWER